METASNGSTVVKRTRRGGKRLRFKAPRPALPVRGLWEAATAEEKERAHKSCVALLEWWVGRRSKESVAGELGVTGLRVWQLSQSALSGMLAGLLRQPRRRGRAAMRTALDDRSQDLNSLRKENAELKRRLTVAERLIILLRDLPEAKARSLLEAQVSKRPEAKGRSGGKKVGSRRVDAGGRDDADAGSEPAPSR
jgi:hypothetical protein